LKLVIRTDSLQLLGRLSRLLTKKGVRSYLVGGFVRDSLLGRDTADIDIAVAGDVLGIAAGAADALGGRYITLDEENGVGRVVLNQDEGKLEIDFTMLKGDIEHDLAQRDFTIDAIALGLDGFTKTIDNPHDKTAEIEIGPGSLIDPFHGLDDLHSKVVRATSDTAFKDDPARLIRAVRLAAELEFSIDGGTEALIRRHSHLIVSIAGERVREELLRLLALPQVGQHLVYLDRLGILTAIIPELEVAKGVSQPPLHVWDVFDHSLKTVAAAEFLLREGDWEVDGDILATVPWSARLEKHFDQEVASNSTRRSLLKLAAFLHDIAKPPTKTVDGDGRARFLGHPQQGAEMAAAIMARLRFSTREIKLVGLMVKNHLRPTQMSHEGLPTPRAIYRYFRDTGEAGIDILFLSLADHLATRGNKLDMAQWQGHASIVEHVLTRHFEEENLTAPPKLIDGHDLIKSFNLSPGPAIGELLEAVREAQAAGEINTRQQALDYVKHIVNGGQGPRQEPS